MSEPATIAEIKNRIEQIDSEDDPYLQSLSEDPRKGVQALLSRWNIKKSKQKEDVRLYEEMSYYENLMAAQGFQLIAGIDEAGRGPLAGPVVSAAVILGKDCFIPGLNDSKKVSAVNRERLAFQIEEKAAAVGIGIIESSEVDRLNIYEATKKSMLLAISQMGLSPDFLLTDAMELDSPFPQEALIKGDAKSVSIAAASIMAKVKRDNIMDHYHRQYPEYGFNVHKGYGTKQHIEALKAFGPCPIHRFSFSPVREAQYSQ